MKVRILGEGQLEVPDGAADELNRLDAELVSAVESRDEDSFAAALAALVAAVRSSGTPLPEDYLGPSDAVVPGRDASLGEVLDLLGEEGLIPG